MASEGHTEALRESAWAIFLFASGAMELSEAAIFLFAAWGLLLLGMDLIALLSGEENISPGRSDSSRPDRPRRILS